ncbi:5-hydroxytryptamine receptor 2A isoform X1 [Drosophila nasuta]|uniref:5-hydroxytryptamine receptor 2A isoform X1 n=1 Tax=Drosophila nasuta TaxID=42062 RepID=UPI00295E22F5|nr:5-hydroxytryptamine receptor 2A isoform X1 [Drosophila nasuta]
MDRKTNFNDALDYIYIANSMNDNAYLIAEPQRPKDDDDNNNSNNNSNDDEDEDFAGDDNNNNHYYNDGGGDTDFRSINAASTVASTTTSTTTASSPLATAALAAAAATASVAAAAARITAKAAHRALATSSSSGNGKAIELIDVDGSNGVSVAAAAAAATTDNNYTNVAVGLGAMLLNDTLLLEANETALSIFGDLVNGTGQLMNASGAVNVTDSKVDEDDFTQLLRMAVTSVLLGLMILVTIIGNVFVIAAIILERNLQNVANYLVASLAVADLFVACLVMPLGAVYEISQGWILGPELCDIWTSCDVLCCTASILHLVAIAVDRYWAVTNIDYIHSRTSNRVFMMIFCVWSASVIVSLAPQFGWKDPDYLQRIEQQKCMVSQDVAYQVFATCCTFYVPLLVILALYWKIYQTARKRIHRRRPRPVDVAANNNQPDGSATSDTKLNRLRLRLGRFSKAKNKSGSASGSSGGAGAGGGGTTALGLVEGNSTNTVNTVEDTEFSSSNVDSKSRAGIEAPSTSGSQIATVSHLVALANQQHASSTKQQRAAGSGGATAATASANVNGSELEERLQEEQQDEAMATTTATSAAAEATATPTATAATAAATTPSKANGSSHGAGAVEVLEDPQLQQQLEQMQQLQKTAKSGGGGGGGGGGASTSNATTITSISALSPQTPTSPAIAAAAAAAAAGPMTAKTSTLTSCNQAHPLCSSANASGSVTPEPRTKQPQQTASSHQQPQQQQQQQQLSSIANPMQKVNKRKETLEAKRERKAAKTLAIITGAFVVCWLPFFVMALTMPLCAACQISDSVASLFLWLGYFNSTLNPVIYTIFSPEFRQAFKRILFGGHRPVHYRSGKL